MFGDLRTVLSWLTPRERWRWYLLVPVAAVSALVEAVGALAVFGLLRLVIDPSLMATTPVVDRILAGWAGGDTRRAIVLLTVAVAVFYVGRALLLIGAEWHRQRVSTDSAAVAAERLYARYLAADYLFHVRRRSASLIEPLTRAADLSYDLVAVPAVNILVEVITILALVGVLVVSAPAAVGVVAVVMVLAAIPAVMARRAWSGIGERERAISEQQLHLLRQSLGAIKDVLVTGRQGYFDGQFRQARRGLSRVKRRRTLVTASARLGVEAALILAMLLVLLVVTGREGAAGAGLSVLALFAYTGFRAVPSANRIMLNLGYWREGRPWVKSIQVDMAGLAAPVAKAFAPEAEVTFHSALACEGVTVVYEEGERPALQDVSFVIHPGESIGIVGPTGSGKSTLVDVLLGLIPPTAGRVTIDGVPLAGHEGAWQRRIGYVPQDVYLLDDTLRRNIAFGVPDSAVDEARVARAISLARLDAVVEALPRKLETVVGEDGVRLSGGQRQRVAIARALYHDPDVIVFDEATAALDNQTERELTAAIAELRGTRTLIAIAHRLSTVRDCDRLVFLQDGTLAGIGPYDALLSNGGFKSLT